MLDTRPLLLNTDFPPLLRSAMITLQVNLGYRCNQSCSHCHVNAGPNRTEMMDSQTLELVVEVLRRRRPGTLDLTGGAPELHPRFQELVKAARDLGIEVIDRCNLTVLLEPGYEDLPRFLADNQVGITASLPCYSEANVDGQRGKGVFEKSILALQKLNRLGYGRGKHSLNLVYNPTGPFLPPPQGQLERDYKERLQADFGIVFDNLFTITNLPISRFGAVLLAQGQYRDYMTLLKDNFSAGNMETVMCRTLVSVDWQGYLYDCDFNQMLNLPMATNTNAAPAAESDQLIAAADARHLKDLLSDDFCGESIVTGEHCYGCTAGQGSSCGGALTTR